MAQVQREVEITDRERIAMAVGELVERGYVTMPGWTVCCSSCGWAEIGRLAGVGRDEDLPEGFKTIWWHEQGDSYAFAENPGIIPQTNAFLEQLSEHEDDGEEWFESHAQEAQADSVLARLTEYATLLSPLYVHWLGDSAEIAAALRAQGLRVQVPEGINKCIVVLPMEATFAARAINGEVMLEIDGDEILLTSEDARKLVRKLNRAARLAEGQMPRI